MTTATLYVAMFGKLSIRRGQHPVRTLDARKLQELFSYLVLHRDRQHPREMLADRFWGDHSASQSRTYLRKALWEVQSAISGCETDLDQRVLLVDSDWVQLNSQANFWLDIAEFEQAFNRVKDMPGEQISASDAQQLQIAVDLYRGDLLEGLYHDWCLYERERLQQIYLSMLDKLIGYCEVRYQYEQGMEYGHRILRYDHAHEQTHRRLMRLQFLAGDRTGALRQYEHCATALKVELGVTPTECTMALYEQIKSNRSDDQARSLLPATPTCSSTQLVDVLVHLRELQIGLDTFRDQVAHDIKLVSEALE